ncbi:MAG TPA: sulfatase-like hydrolase/transferase [Candidatus Polarisedimenticolia bacterium]|nr:sulfatase-like hydrolase/transferase [Candidatus Polarisedimenticolia bacterium]
MIVSSRTGRARGFVLALWLLAGSGALPLAAPANPSSPAPRRLNLLLITAEGLRPDRLGCYGGKQAIATPHVDALAAEGRLFEQVLTSSVSSVPAVASLLTGRTPFEHQVWDDHYRNRLPASALTLAERLKQEGYATAAFVATSRLWAGRGLDQGFDLYQDGYRPPADGVWKLSQRTGSAVVAGAKSWIEGLGGGPFFLWIHFIDPSAPTPPPEKDQEAAWAAYAAHVQDFDARLGEVVEILEKKKLWDSTVAILTSDHGLGLGEHGETRSGIFLYDSTVRVPLIVRTPAGDFRRGSRSADLAGTVDVFPTVERLLSLDPAPGSAGRDLFANAPAVPAVYYSAALLGREVFGWAPLELMARGSQRLIAGAADEFYDVSADPRQEKDLGAVFKTGVLVLKEARRRMAAASPFPPAHFLAGRGLPSDLSKRLREKGYVNPTAERAKARALPDPRRFASSLPILEMANLAVELKKEYALVDERERLAQTDPEGLFPLLHVAGLMMDLEAAEPQSGEGFSGAAALLKEAQKTFPLEPDVYHRLGHLAIFRKEYSDAELFMKAAAELSPQYPTEVSYDLACAYALRGKKAAAIEELRHAIRLGFRDASHISADPDLRALRADPSYKRLMAEEFPASIGR